MYTTDSIAQRKAEIRRKILNQRLAASEEECQTRSALIHERLFAQPEFDRARIIAFYLAIDKEVRTQEMVREALRQGKRVLIPKLYREPASLLLSEVQDIDVELRRGPWGILEPQEQYLRPIPLAEVELILVPGVAFDLQGGRIGFGKGYYDRMLSRVERPVGLIGLAFEFQVLPEVPQQEHDIPVHKIITEKRVICCGL
ncbi:MAG: 5-formyltetrahydrofolate cyclo-ligase [Candidatus Tectomicrobia bacterium]|uniref:5-formyltetrahydrofolate cyclo-ligase n=1 Tax=Tectimicrobiota bacterium TaxID=2528274 RepID=A0A932FXZ7_UNCTE|nr:5-formyltetrahydrofolate cyclo-ligase [Candidatus Tectomicrobia bacterium]